MHGTQVCDIFWKQVHSNLIKEETEEIAFVPAFLEMAKLQSGIYVPKLS